MGILAEIRGGQIMGELKKQLPFAISQALNKTGFEVIKDLKAEMTKVFDNPTPYTLKSNRFQKANYKENKLSFEIGLQEFGGWREAVDHELSFDVSGSKRNATEWNKFLGPQIHGGSRSARSSELRLRESGVMKPNQFWVKGEGARLDRYGNIAPGQIIQILSALQSFNDSGYKSNYQPSRGKNTVGWRKTKNPLAEKLLVIKEYKNRGKLYPGVYKLTNPVTSKSGKVRYTNLSPLLIFMQNPTYKPRYDFFGVGQRSFDNKFETKLNEAIQYALATAK